MFKRHILTRPLLGGVFSPTQPTDCFAIDVQGHALGRERPQQEFE